MFKFRPFSSLFLILLALIVITGVNSAQHLSAGEPEPQPPFFAGSQEIATNNGANEMTGLEDWSMIAYQALDGDNWDIYLYYNSSSHRLTFDNDTDQHPSLDRGTRRVAFVSDRSGDFDLYLIKANGKDLFRILDTGSTIAHPVWSPDGRRLALQLEVAGQFEIYLVDDNGRNLQRLTDNPAFDGKPAWSPDGQQIAFESDRSGDHSIYVMNADGSNVRKVSSYPSSSNPAWSPDGQTIAFDADIDGDSFQELASVDFSGANERTLYNPAGRKSVWAGSWAPDQSGIGFNEITFSRNDQGLFWTNAVVRAWNPNHGAVDLFPGGNEWHMMWQSSDDKAPTAAFDATPEYSRAKDFQLSWSGVDEGGSQLKSYTISVNRKDGSGWQTYWGNTTRTMAPFSAEPGEMARFQIQATDNAFNKSPWLLQNIFETTFYSSRFVGTINDNRANPLSDVTIEVAPALSDEPLVSNWLGEYLGFNLDNNDRIISIQDPDFAPMPETTVKAGEDFRRYIYMRPADSLILNGTFESSASTPTDWEIVGELPVKISDGSAASGSYAVQLGPDPDTNAMAKVQIDKTATISQVVTIPADMQGPTLSYMVRKSGGDASINSDVHVRLQAEGEEKPMLINAVSGSQWGFRFFDMTPWLGQKVSVGFELVQQPVDPPQTVFVDDISLGSSHPDLWVYLARRHGTVFPGSTASLIVYYGNRGSLVTENTLVEVELPPDVTLEWATPPYTINGNIVRWDLGDLAPSPSSARLRINVKTQPVDKKEYAAEASISSTSSELRLGNNSFATKFRTSKDQFLPHLSTD